MEVTERVFKLRLRAVVDIDEIQSLAAEACQKGAGHRGGCRHNWPSGCKSRRAMHLITGPIASAAYERSVVSCKTPLKDCR